LQYCSHRATDGVERFPPSAAYFEVKKGGKALKRKLKQRWMIKAIFLQAEVAARNMEKFN